MFLNEDYLTCIEAKQRIKGADRQMSEQQQTEIHASVHVTPTPLLRCVTKTITANRLGTTRLRISACKLLIFSEKKITGNIIIVVDLISCAVI